MKLVHNPILFTDLPSNSIALDGAVRGCHLDLSTNRWSFDHHASDQPSLSTRSTAAQVLAALTCGLNVSGIENLFVSSIDADSVISTAMILNRELADRTSVIELILLHLDLLDSLGPAAAIDPREMAFHNLLRSGWKEELTTELLLQKVQVFNELVEGSKIFDRAEPRREECHLVSISEDETFSDFGKFGFKDLYKHANVGILFNEESGKVTLGAKSNFVTSKHFLNDGLFVLLNDAEVAKGAPVNHEGVIVDAWGGKDLVGGSPFKGRTLLSVEEVTAILKEFLYS
ncbi:MAG: hypothetical protein P8N24_01375 [Hellea sp.]|nr:hypothetical protein [Hellea sp.]